MKVLFFDIDGTLVNKNAVVADSTYHALDLAHKAGHKLFLCTGRNVTQIFKPLLEYGFDGIVSCAGASCYIGKKQIAQHLMKREKVEQFLNLFENRNISYGVQTESGAYVTEEGWELTKRRFLECGASEKVTALNMKFFHKVPTLHERTDVEKTFYNFVPETVDEVQKKLGDYFTVQESSFSDPDPHSGEITIRGITKTTGMKEVVSYYGKTLEDAVAFGDGPNDLDMVENAGIGVCMGNGRKELKRVADLVTDDINENGIYNAMEKLKLF